MRIMTSLVSQVGTPLTRALLYNSARPHVTNQPMRCHFNIWKHRIRNSLDIVCKSTDNVQPMRRFSCYPSQASSQPIRILSDQTSDMNNKTLHTSRHSYHTPLLHLSNQHQSNVIQVRWYAKKKAKKEKGKKSSKPKVDLSSEEISEVMDIERVNRQMEGALEDLKQEYIQQLSIRSAAGALDKLTVETPDGKFPLIQLGQIAQKNPQLVVINMAGAPQYTSHVKETIISSGMNLNPQQDGTSIFVPIPKVTKEHRENLAKSAKTLCDRTKDRLRDIQNKSVRDVKKVKDQHSSDLIHNVQELIQTKTKEYTEEAERMMTIKQQELLQK